MISPSTSGDDLGFVLPDPDADLMKLSRLLLNSEEFDSIDLLRSFINRLPGSLKIQAKEGYLAIKKRNSSGNLYDVARIDL